MFLFEHVALLIITTELFQYYSSKILTKHGLQNPIASDRLTIGNVSNVSPYIFINAFTCDVFVFQARSISTGQLAAVKIIKLEPGTCMHYINTPSN